MQQSKYLKNFLHRFWSSIVVDVQSASLFSDFVHFSKCTIRRILKKEANANEFNLIIKDI